MEELISVIMPTKNGHNTIERAVKSVINQTYQNWELIIISDYDSDKEKTLNVLKHFNDKRIKYLDADKKVSASYLRNIGIKASNGTYLAFLDDDDEWNNLKLYTQLSFLKNNPDYKSVLTDYQINNGKSIKFINTNSLDYTKDVLLMKIKVAAGSNLFVEKAEVEKIKGFDETFNGHQDLEFLIRLDQEHKIGHIPGALLTIYGRGGRVATNTDILLSVKEKFLNKFEYIIKKYPTELRNRIYARHMLQISRGYAIENNVEKSKEFLNKSLKYSKLNSDKYYIIPHESYFLIYYLNILNSLKYRLSRKK